MIALVEVFTPIKESDAKAGVARFTLRRYNVSTSFTYDDEVDFLINVFDRTRQGALRYRSVPDAVWLSPHRKIPPIIQLPALLCCLNALTGLARLALEPGFPI